MPIILYRPILALIFALLVGFASTASSVRAAEAKATAPRVLSTSDPIIPLACGSDANHQAWEQEATLAVNPRDPKNIVAAWIQDWSDGIVVSYSTDKGTSWDIVVPPTNRCTGGPPLFDGSAFDPRLAFGPTATSSVTYLSAVVSGNPSNGNASFAAVVDRSTDGGRTWNDRPPAVLDTAAGAPGTPLNPPTGYYIDGPSFIIADQVRPGRAYATWNKGDYAKTSRDQYLAFTLDGGSSWSAPIQVTSGQYVLCGQLVILPDGTLVDVFSQIDPRTPASGTTLMTTRSTNGGLTWSTPVAVDAKADQTHWTRVSAVLGPDGHTIHLAWVRANSGGSSISVMSTKSTNAGLTWQTPGVVATEPGVPEGDIISAPSLAVNNNGTIGIAFYDHRRDPLGTDPPRATDLWFRYSQNASGNWKEIHLAGPFDETTAPSPFSSDPYPAGVPGRVGGGFIGDFQGIAPTADGFVSAFTLAKPLAAPGTPNADGFYTNPTDIYFAKVTVP